MKKFFVALATFLATFTLVACHKNNSSSDTKQADLSSMPKITGFSYEGDIPKILKKSSILPILTQATSWNLGSMCLVIP